MKMCKKIVLGLILLFMIAFVGCIAYIFLIPNPDDLGNSTKYHTREELTDLYWQNKELLSSVKDSVISSKKMLQALDEYNEGDYDVSYMGDKRFFNDEEWGNILAVFENLRANMLMLERKGRPLIFYITFAHQKQDDITKSTYLYWFPNDEERAYHEEDGIFPDGVFTQIDDGWYIVETMDTR